MDTWSQVDTKRCYVREARNLVVICAFDVCQQQTHGCLTGSDGVNIGVGKGIHMGIMTGSTLLLSLQHQQGGKGSRTCEAEVHSHRVGARASDLVTY